MLFQTRRRLSASDLNRAMMIDTWSVPSIQRQYEYTSPHLIRLLHDKHTTHFQLQLIHTQLNMAQINWRTINIDLLDPDSSANFDLTSLTPAVQPISTSDVQTLAGQIRQLSRGGDPEGALRGALENPPYGADAQGKVCPVLPCPALSHLYLPHPPTLLPSTPPVRPASKQH